MFERDPERRFKRARGVSAQARSWRWATHDLPHVRGWWWKRRSTRAQRRRSRRTALDARRGVRCAARAPSAAHAAVAARADAIATRGARVPRAHARRAHARADGGRAGRGGAGERARRRGRASQLAAQAPAAVGGAGRAIRASGEHARVALPRSAARAAARQAAGPTEARIPRATYRLQLHGELHVPRRDAARPLPRRTRREPRVLLAVPARARRQHARLRHRRPRRARTRRSARARTSTRSWRTLRAHGMGQLMDIVPNHMGVHGRGQRAGGWTCSRTAPPRRSPTSSTSTGTRRAPHLADRVLLPVLGEHYGARARATASCSCASSPATRRVRRLVLRPSPADRPAHVSARPRARAARARCAGVSRASCADAARNLPARGELPPRPECVAPAQSNRAKDVQRRALARARAAPTRTWPRASRRAVAAVNGTPGDPASFDALHDAARGAGLPARVLARGAATRSTTGASSTSTSWRRCAWRTRRCSTRRTASCCDLVREGDGRRRCASTTPTACYDPRQYFRAPAARVRAARRTWWWRRSSRRSRTCPRDWPVHGTTGYRFANVVNGLFVDDDGASARSTRTYAVVHRRATRASQEVARDARRLILRTSLASELDRAHEPSRAHRARRPRHARLHAATTLREALAEVIAAFPVYRTYVDRRTAPAPRTGATSTGPCASRARGEPRRRRERLRLHRARCCSARPTRATTRAAAAAIRTSPGASSSSSPRR